MALPNQSNVKELKAMKKQYGIYVIDYGMYDDFYRLYKLGETGNLEQRLHQHEEKGNKFIKGKTGNVVLWRPVSQYNTKRYEDKNRAIWDNTPGFERCYRCKDTFLVDTRIVTNIEITIKKTYTVAL